MLKPGGATPTTSYGSPSSRTLVPTMFGFAPNRRVHSACPRTTRRCWPGCASPSTNSRPSEGATPSRMKNPGDTLKPGTCSGMSTPDRFASHHRYIAHRSVVLACSRHSRKSAPLTFCAIDKLVVRRASRHDEQTIDAGKAIRPQHQRIHQAEGRAVGGERQRQRQHDHAGQRRALQNRAPRIQHIAGKTRPTRGRPAPSTPSRSSGPAACGAANESCRNAPRCQGSGESAIVTPSPRRRGRHTSRTPREGRRSWSHVDRRLEPRSTGRAPRICSGRGRGS